MDRDLGDPSKSQKQIIMCTQYKYPQLEPHAGIKVLGSIGLCLWPYHRGVRGIFFRGSKVIFPDFLPV